MSTRIEAQDKQKPSIFTAIGHGMDALVDKMMGHNYKTYYNFEELREITAEQLPKAQQYALFVEGRFNHAVYNDNAVVAALEKAVERGVKVELIGGPDPDPESTRLWQLVNKGAIDYYQLKSSHPTHFALVDGGYVRVEYPHSPERSAPREGKVSLSGDENLAATIYQTFSEIRTEATKVEKVTFE